MDNKQDNKQCMCKNLSTLIDLVDFFDEIGGKNIKQHETTQKQRNKAVGLVDKLTNIMLEKDMIPYSLEKSTVNNRLDGIRKYRREYDETGGSEIIYAIDDIRGLIHADIGIRAKLLCQKEFHSKENYLLYESLKILRGNGTSIDSKKTIRSLYKDATCTNLFGEKEIK